MQRIIFLRLFFAVAAVLVADLAVRADSVTIAPAFVSNVLRPRSVDEVSLSSGALPIGEGRRDGPAVDPCR